MNENSFLATNTAKNRNGVPSCTRHYCAADKLLAHKEIVFMGQEPGDLISVELFINGIPMYSCSTNGFGVATPAGCSGYTLAAGGPIVRPSCQVAVITCLCPHTIHQPRPIAITPADSIEVRIDSSNQSNNAEICVIVDSQLQIFQGPCFTSSLRYEPNVLRGFIANNFDSPSKKG